MSEKPISPRAQKVLTLMRQVCHSLGGVAEIWIRQATLAEHFECSRTTIWRALNQLKEAGLIVDVNKRHEYRYKIYQVQPEISFKTRFQEKFIYWEKTFLFLDGVYAPKVRTVIQSAVQELQELKETLPSEQLFEYIETYLLKTTQEAYRLNTLQREAFGFRKRDPTCPAYWGLSDGVGFAPI